MQDVQTATVPNLSDSVSDVASDNRKALVTTAAVATAAATVAATAAVSIGGIIATRRAKKSLEEMLGMGEEAEAAAAALEGL